MRKLTLAPFFNIQLFAEGGGAAAGGEGAAAAAPVAAPQQPGVKSNPLADVQYGKQESAPAAGEKGSAEERNSRFEELIKGEFKDLYDARVQNTIRERLKGNEATVQKYNALAPVLDLLAGKYGVEADNIEALSKAIEEDETFYEDEALEKGLTVQQVKEIRKMQRENAALKAQVEERSRKENADATYAAWMQQAEALKQVYPSFDFATEAQNEQFRRLLQSGIPLQTAFEVIHKDEIIPAAMQYTAKQVEAKVANNVRAGQKRPAEGAAGGRSAVQVKSDPSKFTKADMDEIARRVARGERIVL
ncbi:MAG: hypothetical protein IKE47_02230 [Oscillospiraceae bacterium]|nr:hypothetical protein [Oscillospiraceae bacterium]